MLGRKKKSKSDKKANFDKIKTVFWCREVFKKLGISHPKELRVERGVHSKAGTNLDNKMKDVPYEVSDVIYDDASKWSRYYRGETVPYSANKNNNKNLKNIRVREVFDHYYPDTKEYFEKGPLGLFSVFEAESELEAHRAFAVAIKKFCELNNEGIPQYSNEVHSHWFVDWNDIKKQLVPDSSVSFDRLLAIVLNSDVDSVHLHQKNELDSDIERGHSGLLLLRMQGAFIESKYKSNHFSLAYILFCNQSAIQYFENKYNVKPTFWFKSRDIINAFIYCYEKQWFDMDVTFFKEQINDHIKTASI